MFASHDGADDINVDANKLINKLFRTVRVCVFIKIIVFCIKYKIFVYKLTFLSFLVSIVCLLVSVLLLFKNLILG